MKSLQKIINILVNDVTTLKNELVRLKETNSNEENSEIQVHDNNISTWVDVVLGQPVKTRQVKHSKEIKTAQTKST